MDLKISSGRCISTLLLSCQVAPRHSQWVMLGDVGTCTYAHFLCTLISMSTNTFLKLWVYTNSNLKPTRFIPIFSLSIFVTSHLQEFRSLKQTPTKNTFLRFSAFSLPARLKKKITKLLNKVHLFFVALLYCFFTHTHVPSYPYIYIF